jgi:hypothetical protein
MEQGPEDAHLGTGRRMHSGAADYEELVTTYLNLPSRPTVYVSTPLPLPMDAGTGPTTDVILPAIENIAAKYHLAIVPLYPAFLNQPQLYKDATHPTDTTGLKTIADTVYATMMATMGSCVDGGLLPPPANGGAGADATRFRRPASHRHSRRWRPRLRRLPRPNTARGEPPGKQRPSPSPFPGR